MRSLRPLSLAALVALALISSSPRVLTSAPAAPTSLAGAPTVGQFMGAPSALEVVAARKTDRVAWIAYEQGRRNIYTASAPAFTPVKLTNFTSDDGVDMTDVQISADGSTVVFIRGSAKNREGWNANPSSDPNGGEEAIWAARVAAPGRAWRLAEGTNPAVAPDGSSVLFTKDGQIYRVVIPPSPAASEIDRGEKPFIREWGANGSPAWAPDGKHIAFVSVRGDHDLIGLYAMATRTVTYLAPSVDRDSTPIWSSDSRHVSFFRRPGQPFGQQTPAVGFGAAGQGGGRGGPGGGGAAPAGRGAAAQEPGLMSSAFKGGYTFAIWTADILTGDAHEVWHNETGDRQVTGINNPRWAGDGNIVYTAGGRGGGGGGRRGGGAPAGPVDEWDRYYSLRFADPAARPVELTTTDGLIEDAQSVAVSPDGATFFYCTNAHDIERRHIWAVPSTGGEPRQVTTGEGIETFPAPLASNTRLATLSASWNMPMSLGVWTGGTQRVVFPASRPGFPVDAHVKPELVVTHAADGLEIHNDLFVPKDIAPGEKHPAMIFVHGGPVRQMLLGYHYRYVYHMFYATNEWLAAHGYVVLSINYRSGIGYGRSFQQAPNTQARGNAEYQDVVAGAQYLASRGDVDPKRIGIYGLSYGGLLTSQALARNSDLFALGVDYAGVHLYGSSLDPSDLSYRSSAISQIDRWTSPVLLIQGDDDRNVWFAQTVGLVQLLRQRDVYYELVVFPDDVHDSLIYGRWMYLLGRMQTFVDKFFGPVLRR